MLKKLLLGAALAVGGLALTTTTAEAQGPHRGPRPYYRTQGVRFNGGYYYNGRNHNHWGGRVWNARFGRHHYWDRDLKCYYYWHAPRNCYLPCDVPCPF